MASAIAAPRPRCTRLRARALSRAAADNGRRNLDFTFAIAFTPRENAGDWDLAQALLALTLKSCLAQSEPDVRVLIAGHERPRLPDDPRIVFTAVDWPVEPPGPHNDDSGRKKHLLSELILSRGGGLMMIADADDWVDRRTAEVSRRAFAGSDAVGAVLTQGEVVDLATLAAAPLPHPQVFGDFHRVCGTSTVTRLDPEASDPARRDPFAVLRSHHAWLERGEELGLPLLRLPVRAAYLVGTSINHSDVHGPHPDWRRGFRAAVNAHGAPLDAATAARFGLELDEVRAVSARLARRPLDGPA